MAEIDLESLKSLETRLKKIQKDIKSNRIGDAIAKTENMLARCSDSIAANVIGAELILTLEMGEEQAFKQQALKACLKAQELILAESDPIVDMHYKDRLQTLKSVCVSLKRWDIVTKCYASIFERSSDLEFLERAFDCQVHQYSFQKQKEVAMKLYMGLGSKGKEHEQHLLWLICSLQLEAFGCEDPDKLLRTAKNVYNLHVRTHGPVNHREGILLCFSLFEQLQNYKAAIELIPSLTSQNWVTEINGLHMEGRLLASDKKYMEAADVFRRILTACPDDWEAFLHYLSCVLEGDCKWSYYGTNNDIIHPPKFGDGKLLHLSDVQFDSRMETVSDFVRGLMPSSNSGGIIRCPFLALVEIERRKFLQGRSDGETLVKVLLDYFHRFGQLAFCVSDVESSLQLLTPEKTRTLVEGFKSAVPLPTPAQKITLFKLQELLELSLGDLENNAVTMTVLFTGSLVVSNNLDFQQSIHCQDPLSLACNALVQLFWRTQRVGYLMEAILIMEFGLTVRRCIPKNKILLLHLYSHLGAYTLAYDCYKSLGIEKNLLLETVSHHILPHVLSSPFLAYSSNLLEEYLSFMEYFFSKSADFAIDAYHRNSYSTIYGDFLLRNRLLHSHNYLMSRIETSILQLKLKANNIVDTEHYLRSLDNGTQLLQLASEESLKSVVVNEDMQARPWWSPTPDRNFLVERFQNNRNMSIRPNIEDKNHLRLQEQLKKLLLLKRKSLLLQLISLSIKSASLFLNQDAASSSTQDADSSSTQDDMFWKLLVEYAGTLGFSFIEAENMVHGVTSFKEVSSSVDLLCFAVFLNAYKLGIHEVGLSPAYWSGLDRLFGIFTEEGIMPEHHLLIAAPGVLLSSFVQLVTEPLAWHCLVLQSCSRLLVSLRKRKKKKGEPTEQLTPAKKKKRERAEQLNKAVVSSIESLCGTVELVKRRLTVLEKSLVEGKNMDTVFSPLDSSEDGLGGPVGPGRVFAVLRNFSSPDSASWNAATVEGKLTKSLKETLSEFHQICQMKLALLKVMKKDLKPLHF